MFMNVDEAVKEIMDIISEGTNAFQNTMSAANDYPKVNEIFSDSWNRTLGRYRKIAEATN